MVVAAQSLLILALVEEVEAAQSLLILALALVAVVGAVVAAEEQAVPNDPPLTLPCHGH